MDKPDPSEAPVRTHHTKRSHIPKDRNFISSIDFESQNTVINEIINRTTGNHGYRSDNPRMRGLYQHTLQFSTPEVCLCGFGAQSWEEANIFVSLSTQARSGVHLDSNPVENGVTAAGVKQPRRRRD
jgi:hypothetical protein